MDEHERTGIRSAASDTDSAGENGRPIAQDGGDQRRIESNPALEIAPPEEGKPVLLEPVHPTALEPLRPSPPPPPRREPPRTEPPRSEPQPPPAPPARRGWRGWLRLLILGLIILAVFFVYRACGGAITNRSRMARGGVRGRGGEMAAATITSGAATTGNMNVFVEALGTVTPIATITLFSQVTGMITTVYYHEGQMVNQGDPLIEIDPRPFQALLTQAEGALQRDQAQLAQALMDLRRYQDAWARNAIARQQLEDQEKLVQQLEGTVKADQAAVDYSRVQLSYCHITAPVSGKVGLRLVDPGNTVFAGSSSTLVVITQLQPITVVFNVSENDLSQVQSALRTIRTLPVLAYDRANEKEIEAGTLTSLDNAVDTTTGTIKFRAAFQNRRLMLFPNQFVNARLLVRTLRKVVLVPSVAVQHNGTAAFVYAIGPDNKARVQNVQVLASNDQNTAVGGLNAGAAVATSGFDRLENNVLVSINNKGPRPAQLTPGRGTNRQSGGNVKP